jgi:hypothetical protein
MLPALLTELQCHPPCLSASTAHHRCGSTCHNVYVIPGNPVSSLCLSCFPHAPMASMQVKANALSLRNDPEPYISRVLSLSPTFGAASHITGGTTLTSYGSAPLQTLLGTTSASTTFNARSSWAPDPGLNSKQSKSGRVGWATGGQSVTASSSRPATAGPSSSRHQQGEFGASSRTLGSVTGTGAVTPRGTEGGSQGLLTRSVTEVSTWLPGAAGTTGVAGPAGQYSPGEAASGTSEIGIGDTPSPWIPSMPAVPETDGVLNNLGARIIAAAAVDRIAPSVPPPGPLGGVGSTTAGRSRTGSTAGRRQRRGSLEDGSGTKSHLQVQQLPDGAGHALSFTTAVMAEGFAKLTKAELEAQAKVVRSRYMGSPKQGRTGSGGGTTGRSRSPSPPGVAGSTIGGATRSTPSGAAAMRPVTAGGQRGGGGRGGSASMYGCDLGVGPLTLPPPPPSAASHIMAMRPHSSLGFMHHGRGTSRGSHVYGGNDEDHTSGDDGPGSPLPYRSNTVAWASGVIEGDDEGDECGPHGVTSWGVGVRSTSPEAVTAERQLRLTVTARPASGGSPTRRYAGISMCDKSHYATTRSLTIIGSVHI